MIFDLFRLNSFVHFYCFCLLIYAIFTVFVFGLSCSSSLLLLLFYSLCRIGSVQGGLYLQIRSLLILRKLPAETIVPQGDDELKHNKLPITLLL